MAEYQLFEPGTVPEYTTAGWYLSRDHAPHLEQDLHRGRLDMAAEMVASVSDGPVIDLGAGDGGLLALLRDRHGINDAWGYDLMPSNVEHATQRRKVPVLLMDAVRQYEWVDWREPHAVAVATEMLEHLVDPHRYVQQIADRAQYLVASSPRTETKRHHYEYHTWAWDMAGYRALLENNGFQVLRHEGVDMFQVILGQRQGRHS